MNTLEILKEYIINNINTFIDELSTDDIVLQTIESKNVVIDEIDTDKYLSEVMIYIIPDEYTYERQTFQSDLVYQRVNLFLFVRKDSTANLIKKLFYYNSAFKSTIRNNPTLGSNVDDCILTGQTYYQGVEGVKDIKGMEYNLMLSYQEEY